MTGLPAADRRATRFRDAVLRAVPLALLAATGLPGCVLPSYAKGRWPEDLPAETYYARVYMADAANQKLQSSDTYFDWVLRFYQGYLTITGWSQHELTLAKLLTPEEYVVLAPHLAYVGQIISAEWAKENRLRRIDNNALGLWGRVLQKAAAAHRAGAALDRITQDVHAILEGKLDKTAVKSQRYAEFLTGK